MCFGLLELDTGFLRFSYCGASALLQVNTGVHRDASACLWLFGFVTVLEGVHIVFRAPFMHYVRLKGVRVLESFDYNTDSSRWEFVVSFRDLEVRFEL